MKIHIVQKGDTLWKIAKKYGVNFEELKKMNSQLSNPDMIMPGMKVKVPTTGGHVKKEAPMGTKPAAINQGMKKEMPLAEHPYAKEKPKLMPIVEAPIKEAPIKEIPKAPYVPKMPTPIIPEIDINNYYMMNMANMTVQPPPQLPPKPTNILPEVKEVPKKEIPIVPPPVVQAPIVPPPVECPPVEQPICEPECVPVTPVMPGSGFCPPVGGYPFGAPMPYQDYAGAMSMPLGNIPLAPGSAPPVGGAPYMPIHFEDESSSSFMPNMPMMNPSAHVPPTSPPVQPPYLQQGVGFGGQVPSGYQPVPYQGYPVQEGYPGGAYQGYQGGGYPPMQEGYQGGGYSPMQEGYQGGGYPPMQEGYQGGGYPPPMQEGYPAAGAYPGYPSTAQPGYSPGAYPGGYQGQFTTQQGPRNVYQNPGMMPGYGNPAVYNPYGQLPYGYPQMGPTTHVEYESSDMYKHGAAMQQYPGQGSPLPVATGGLADCGCGAPSAMPQTFVPTTPPVYMAPYTAPSQFAQPPFMNPYGMGPMGAVPYGMPRDIGNNDENGNQ